MLARAFIHPSLCMRAVKALVNLHYLTKLLRKYEGRFYVRREVDLMKTEKVNAYIMHIFGKIELLPIHAT